MNSIKEWSGRSWKLWLLERGNDKASVWSSHRMMIIIDDIIKLCLIIARLWTRNSFTSIYLSSIYKRMLFTLKDELVIPLRYPNCSYSLKGSFSFRNWRGRTKQLGEELSVATNSFDTNQNFVVILLHTCGGFWAGGTLDVTISGETLDPRKPFERHFL